MDEDKRLELEEQELALPFVGSRRRIEDRITRDVALGSFGYTRGLLGKGFSCDSSEVVKQNLEALSAYMSKYSLDFTQEGQQAEGESDICDLLTPTLDGGLSPALWRRDQTMESERRSSALSLSSGQTAAGSHVNSLQSRNSRSKDSWWTKPTRALTAATRRRPPW